MHVAVLIFDQVSVNDRFGFPHGVFLQEFLQPGSIAHVRIQLFQPVCGGGGNGHGMAPVAENGLWTVGDPLLASGHKGGDVIGSPGQWQLVKSALVAEWPTAVHIIRDIIGPVLVQAVPDAVIDILELGAGGREQPWCSPIVNDLASAMVNIQGGMGSDKPAECFQVIGLKEVIVSHDHNKLPAGKGEAFVPVLDQMKCPDIFVVFMVLYPFVIKLGNHLFNRLWGAVVKDDQLKVANGLCKDAVNAFLEVLALVGRDTYGEGDAAISLHGILSGLEGCFLGNRYRNA